MVLKLLLETTIYNFFYYGKAKEKQTYTRLLFDVIAAGDYKPYTSEYIISELAEDKRDKYDEMYRLITEYRITVLPTDSIIERLADRYLAAGIIPLEYGDDAIHIATATANSLDCVVSYNFNHIVKQKTMIGTGFINKREGYPPIIISTPQEVLTYDKGRED